MSRHETAWAPSAPAEDPASLHASVAELIGLLQATLASGGSDEVADDLQALRRALRGVHRHEDEQVLGGRFPGGRVCLVSAPHVEVASVRAELAHTSGVLADAGSPGVVALVAGLPREAASGMRDRVARTVHRIQRVAPTARVGVSTPLGHLSQVRRGLDEATRALELCSPGEAVLADDRWFDVALSRLRDSIRDSLAVDGPLARLDDGTKPGVDLRTTLATWLDRDGDVRATAAALHLHPNSVRYRLQRAARITGLDLADPLHRLVAHLALTSG